VALERVFDAAYASALLILLAFFPPLPPVVSSLPPAP